MIKKYIQSSIGRKQIVAITGLLLFGFLIFHLSANLMFFKGSEAFNFFPQLAHSTGLFLRFVEAGLALIFITHIIATASLVIENIKARKKRYEVSADIKNERSLSTKLMPYTGSILFIFLIVHLKDFVLADHHTVKSIVNNENAGLYGLVYNTLKEPARYILYLLAMCSVGFHLAHGIQSVFQSMGFNHKHISPTIKRVSITIGLVFTLGFGSIIIFILINSGALGF